MELSLEIVWRRFNFSNFTDDWVPDIMHLVW